MIVTWKTYYIIQVKQAIQTRIMVNGLHFLGWKITMVGKWGVIGRGEKSQETAFQKYTFPL